jgi:hypothetical protein
MKRKKKTQMESKSSEQETLIYVYIYKEIGRQTVINFTKIVDMRN